MRSWIQTKKQLASFQVLWWRRSHFGSRDSAIRLVALVRVVVIRLAEWRIKKVVLLSSRTRWLQCWSCETSIGNMGVQSFEWKWNSGTCTYIVVPSLSTIVAIIYTDIISMVTAIKQLARGGASTAGVIIVLLRCMDQRNSVTHLILCHSSVAVALHVQVLARQCCAL